MSKAAELAALIGSQSSLSNRNMIINGNMEVAQRSTSVAVTASGYHTCDRWAISLSSAGRFTMSQESITDLEGFGKALKLDCTTADTSIASDELLLLYQRFEGQFLQKMQKGFSTAKPVTLSFYVKGNANATYVAELLDADNSNRHINKSFSVTTSWSRVSLTFPGDTTGKLDADNANSLRLHIWLHGGSNYTSGTLQTSWGSIVAANRAAGISSFFDSTDREFFITGVQMELGEVAQPFEHETFADNLQKCQRYYQHLGYAYGDVPGSTSNYNGALETPNPSGSYFYGHQSFPVQMRASPTVTLYSTPAGSTETSGVTIDWNSGSTLGSTSVARINSTGYGYLTAGSGASTGAVYRAVLDAEL